MGGANPTGLRLEANSRFLTLGGRPWLPVMGEFHFSRFPHLHWRDELLKMQAGGVQIVATYIFWIHHEEIEDQFDWSGDRDLRRFIHLCGQLGLHAYPRLGPWAHGECRNGGFPDWLLARCGAALRQDAPLYLEHVRRLYEQIARQLAGLLWRDGGPVIGVQLENELLHNAPHILTLKHLAQAAGIDVPLYTMTGWGPAQVPADEVIPLFGSYPDAFWERQVQGWARHSRVHYFFTPVRDDNQIGADLLPRAEPTDLAQLERYPFATCELGGGMQVAYHRRPFITPEDVAALPLVKLGSGSNLLGYYMYHGGMNPAGRLSTLQESQATGYPNDLPLLDYDFQAPIGAYGQLNPHYHRLRLLHLFLHDFGARLAPLPAFFPEPAPVGLDDSQTLRWAVRSDGQQGFLFINNYQRVEALPARSGVQFELRLAEATLWLPSAPVEVPVGASMIWPFNLDLDGLRLEWATAQPVCRLEGDNGPCYVFAACAGLPAEFCFPAGALASIGAAPHPTGLPHSLSVVEGSQPAPISQPDPARACLLRGLEPGQELRLHSPTEQVARLLLLSAEQARQCWKTRLWGQERLLLSPAGLLFDGETLRLRARRPEEGWLALYPAPAEPLSAHIAPPDFGANVPGSLAPIPMLVAQQGVFTRYDLAAAFPAYAPAARRLQPAGPARRVPLGMAGVAQAPEEADFEIAETWEVRLPEADLSGIEDLFLEIDYLGDCGRAYLGRRLVADHFYNGRPWEIGLKRFLPAMQEQGLLLKFLPLRQETPIYLGPEHRPAFGPSGAAMQVRQIRLQGEMEWFIQPASGRASSLKEGTG
jgi:beta-galactosidase